MTCGNLPTHDHVAHYVRPSKVLDDGSIDGSVFRESALDDEEISVNWLEYFADKDKSERLRAVDLSVPNCELFAGRSPCELSYYGVLTISNSVRTVRQFCIVLAICILRRGTRSSACCGRHRWGSAGRRCALAPQTRPAGRVSGGGFES